MKLTFTEARELKTRMASALLFRYSGVTKYHNPHLDKFNELVDSMTIMPEIPKIQCLLCGDLYKHEEYPTHECTGGQYATAQNATPSHIPNPSISLPKKADLYIGPHIGSPEHLEWMRRMNIDIQYLSK